MDIYSLLKLFGNLLAMVGKNLVKQNWFCFTSFINSHPSHCFSLRNKNNSILSTGQVFFSKSRNSIWVLNQDPPKKYWNNKECWAR